ncbi:MAG TPA: hypothetical protein VFQ02_03785 [Nitrospira sp.]|nr:hypothetical protein [Nitrospira sp.]
MVNQRHAAHDDPYTAAVPRQSFHTPVLHFLLLMVIVNFALQPLTEPDFGWHLRTGLDLLHSGFSLPHSDPYSHTMPDWPWVEHAWLTDVVIGATYSLGGGLGIIILFACVTTSAWLIGSATSRAAVAFRRLACVMSLWVALPYLGARTQLVTLLGLAVLLFLLQRWQDGVPSARWWILPLFLGWANLHGGFLAGLMVLGLIIVTTAILRWLSERRIVLARKYDEPLLSWDDLKRLTLLTMLSAGLTLINPYGWRLHAEIVDSLSDRFMLETLQEWQPLSLSGVAGRRYAVYLAGLTLSMMLWYRRTEPVRWVIGGVFLALSIRHMRNIPFFLICSVSTCADVVAQGFHTLERRWPGRRLAARQGSLAAAVALGAILFWLGADHLQQVAFSGTRPAEYFRSTSYPIEAVEWIRMNRDLLGRRLYNDYAYGGFLLWWLPETRIFIDGRMPAWRRGERHIFPDYMALNGAEPDLTILTKYSIDWAMVRRQTQLDGALSRGLGWTRLYADEKVAIYRLLPIELESSSVPR